MSLTAVRTYFRTILKAQGFTEHKDPFNWENIPATVIDRAFHIESGAFEGAGQNQAAQELRCAVTVRLFFKGLSDVNEGLDKALEKTDATLLQLLSASNRLTGTIKNVILGSVTPEPFAGSNDNLIVVRVEMQARVIMPTA